MSVEQTQQLPPPAVKQLQRTLAELADDARWRARLGIEEWSAPLAETVGEMRRLLTSDAPEDVVPSLDRVLAAVAAEHPGARESETLARGVLRLALEHRRVRHLNLGLSLAGDPR